MKKCIIKLAALTTLFGALLLGGCTQMPTEKQSISDMRPQISFKIDVKKAQGYRVRIDGLDMGMVSDFIDGKAAIRVLPGMHLVNVSSGSTVLLNEKVYLSDGVSRSFNIQ